MDQLTAIANTAAGKLWGYSFVSDADGRVTQKTGPLDSTGLPASTTLYASGPDASGANDTVFKSVTVQGAAYNYFYDALNRRRYKSYPTGISDEFFYDLGHQLLVDQGNSTLSPATAVPVLDEYVWLGGRPVAIIRGNLTAAWAHQADSTGSCARNSEAANCGAYFPITDVIGKAVLMLNAAGRIAGTGEYDPFGQVNRVFVDAESAHPYDSATGVFADFTQAVGSGFAIDMRVMIDLLDLDQYSVDPACTSYTGTGPVDALELRNSADAVLQSLSSGQAQQQGLISSSWTQPVDGRLRLAITGGGHCSAAPPSCVLQCDAITQKSQPGVVAGTYEYRKYETGQIPFWTALRFPGQYFDSESALFENWNRYFTPTLGYLSIDPALTAAKKPSGDTPVFAYASSDPLQKVDPTGRYALKGACPNWESAVELARRKAGCNDECDQSECRKKMPCNICQFLNNIFWPPAFPEGKPCSSFLDPLIGILNGCAEHNSEEGWWIEVLGRACEGASNIDLLAQIIFHESMHMCRSVGAGGFGTMDVPFTDNAETITEICWRQ